MVVTGRSCLLEVTLLVVGAAAPFRAKLRPGDEVRFGRREVAGRAGLCQVGIAPHWLGVQDDTQVPAELLRVRFDEVVDGQARLAWATRTSLHPAAIRVGVSPPDPQGYLRGGTNSAPGGVVSLGERETGRLFVFRLGPSRRMRCRMVVHLALSAAPRPVAVPGAGPRATMVSEDEARALAEVRRTWLHSGRTRAPGTLTWRITCEETLRLAATAAPGQLAETVSTDLADRFCGITVRRVRADWADGIRKLAAVMREPQTAWMADLLAVPGLDDYLAGTTRRLAAGEAQMRHLATVLRGQLHG